MPYSITGDAIIETQIVGRLHGQTTRNIFHYWKTGPVVADGAEELSLFNTQFKAMVYDVMRLCLSEEWALQYLQHQWIHPTRYRARQFSYASGGALAGNSLPAFVSVCISKYAELSGPEYQGRNYFPGVLVDHEVDSKLTVAAQALFGGLADALKEEWSTVNANYKPVITDAATALGTAEYVVQDTVLRDILRVQRRREVGQGE